MATDEYINKWEQKCQVLVGKTIGAVRYMTDEEMRNMYWHRKCVVIIFTDGTYIFPSMDDEGNDAGSLFTNIPNLDGIPVIY